MVCALIELLLWFVHWWSYYHAMCASSSFEWVFIHFYAALDLGADVEQSFSCLITQNRHALRREFGGFDIGGQRGQWSVLVCHTHKPQKGLTSFV